MKKILVIDDIQTNLSYMKLVLEKAFPDTKIFLAESGKTGLEIAEKELPETILLDYNMPGMNGFEVCKILKENEITNGIPVLMVSAYGSDTQIRIDGLLSGADAFISKPFHKDEFIALIKTLLRNKEYDDLLKLQNKNLENKIKNQLLATNQHDQRLAQISDFVLEFFWEVDQDMVFTYLSPTVTNIIGYTVNELTFNYKLFDFVLFEKQSLELNQILSTVKNREPFNRRKLLCKSNQGEHLWLALSGFPVYDDRNSFIGYRGISQNITQRIREEEKHTMVINTSLDGFVMTNANYTVQEVNEAFCRMTGYSTTELIGTVFMESEIKFMEHELNEFPHEQNIPEGKSLLNKHVRIETKIQTKSKKFIDVELSINISVVDDSPKFIFVRDITERKRNEESEAKSLEKIKEYQKKLKILQSKLIAAEEQERKNTAAFLHDGIGQNLAIAYLKLSSLSNKPIDAKAAKIVNESLELINQAIKETRLLTYDLSPPILHELGLISALKWRLDKIHEEFGHHTKTILEEPFVVNNSSTEILIYRIISELFNNIIKHANATLIEVSANRQDAVLSMTIRDNGVGFDVDEIAGKTVGFGLFNIKERIESIHGEIEICSEPAKGTIVKLLIPD